MTMVSMENIDQFASPLRSFKGARAAQKHLWRYIIFLGNVLSCLTQGCILSSGLAFFLIYNRRYIYTSMYTSWCLDMSYMKYIKIAFAVNF